MKKFTDFITEAAKPKHGGDDYAHSQITDPAHHQAELDHHVDQWEKHDDAKRNYLLNPGTGTRGVHSHAMIGYHTTMADHHQSYARFHKSHVDTLSKKK